VLEPWICHWAEISGTIFWTDVVCQRSTSINSSLSLDQKFALKLLDHSESLYTFIGAKSLGTEPTTFVIGPSRANFQTTQKCAMRYQTLLYLTSRCYKRPSATIRPSTCNYDASCTSDLKSSKVLKLVDEHVILSLTELQAIPTSFAETRQAQLQSLSTAPNALTSSAPQMPDTTS
jgi:hypothetical protein